MIYSDFARLVKAKREEKQWSQQQLAEKCGLTRATIMHIENETQKVYLEQALNIASALDISVNELVIENKILTPESGK